MLTTFFTNGAPYGKIRILFHRSIVRKSLYSYNKRLYILRLYQRLETTYAEPQPEFHVKHCLS